MPHAGRAWTGRQALKLGLIDGLGEMQDVMQREYGDKARFLLCRWVCVHVCVFRACLPGAGWDGGFTESWVWGVKMR